MREVLCCLLDAKTSSTSLGKLVFLVYDHSLLSKSSLFAFWCKAVISRCHWKETKLKNHTILAKDQDRSLTNPELAKEVEATLMRHFSSCTQFPIYKIGIIPPLQVHFAYESGKGYRIEVSQL